MVKVIVTISLHSCSGMCINLNNLRNKVIISSGGVERNSNEISKKVQKRRADKANPISAPSRLNPNVPLPSAKRLLMSTRQGVRKINARAEWKIVFRRSMKNQKTIRINAAGTTSIVLFSVKRPGRQMSAVRSLAPTLTPGGWCLPAVVFRLCAFSDTSYTVERKE